MKQKKIMTFASHAEAYCDNCGGDFGDRGWWFTEDHFVQCCERCRTETAYDLEVTDAPLDWLTDRSA